MREQLMLLLRISLPKYNKTLYEDYKLYMNPQMAFKKDGLTDGQRDAFEGAITNNLCKILYSIDNKETWHPLADTTMIHKDSNAYIYCMYGLKYDKKHYDAEHNKYYYNIPWRYIEHLWQGDDTELIVIKNTSVFINKFQKAASKINIPHAYGKVFYDLQDKLINAEYIDLAMQNGFETVFHKLRDGYEIQKEIRFAVKCNDKPDHFELQLENDQKLQFLLCSLKYGRDIMVELSDLEFDEQLGVPVRFSSEIKVYESN